MNTDRQLMQQALDALEIAETDGNCYYEATELLRSRLAHCDRCGKKLGGEGDIHTCTPDPIGDAQDKLIAELAAQPEQEPVDGYITAIIACREALDAQPVPPRYTTPPAALSQAAERNKLATWMIAKGYATGHGDTTEDLLKELEWQVEERGQDAP
jgi:hypothetical protein